MSSARRRDMEVGETASSTVGKGSSEEKSGVMELKASGAAEKAQVLNTDHLPSNDVKKGVCDGRSYASVVATNRPPPRPLPPSRPEPATSSEQTTPEPEEEEEDDEADKAVVNILKISLLGQPTQEGLVHLKDYLILGLKHKAAVKHLRVITDPYVIGGSRPSKLRLATAKYLEKQGLTWEEEKENPGCFLITFDDSKTNGIEKENWSWCKKKRNRRRRKTDVVRR